MTEPYSQIEPFGDQFKVVGRSGATFLFDSEAEAQAFVLLQGDVAEPDAATDLEPEAAPVQAYPAWRYRHDRLERVIVDSEAADRALGDGWYSLPAQTPSGITESGS